MQKYDYDNNLQNFSSYCDYSDHGNHENSAKQLITMDYLLPDSPCAIYPTIF